MPRLRWLRHALLLPLGATACVSYRTTPIPGGAVVPRAEIEVRFGSPRTILPLGPGAPDTLRNVIALRGRVAQIQHDSLQVRVTELATEAGWRLRRPVAMLAIPMQDATSISTRERYVQPWVVIATTGVALALLAVFVFLGGIGGS